MRRRARELEVGVDAGSLVGRPDTGVLATGNKAAILALDADLVETERTNLARSLEALKNELHKIRTGSKDHSFHPLVGSQDIHHARGLSVTGWKSQSTRPVFQ